MSSQQVVDGLSDRHDVRYLEYDNSLTENLKQFNPDVAFPVMHGSPGEDGSIQGYLHVLNIPYIGSDYSASAKAIDKYIAKCIWRDGNIPVLPMQLISKDSYTTQDADQIRNCLGDAVALKPLTQGSALGVHLLPDGGDIDSAIRETFKYGDTLIVEPFIAGREITVAVLENDAKGCHALPIIEICVTEKSEWYDFNNRYTAGKSKHIIDPEMQTEVAEKLKHYAVFAHQMLGCRDLSRSDFILTEDNDIWLLELNSIPGMTPWSLFPDAARAAGIEFEDLLDGLVTQAINRGSG